MVFSVTEGGAVVQDRRRLRPCNTGAAPRCTTFTDLQNLGYMRDNLGSCRSQKRAIFSARHLGVRCSGEGRPLGNNLPSRSTHAAWLSRRHDAFTARLQCNMQSNAYTTLMKS